MKNEDIIPEFAMMPAKEADEEEKIAETENINIQEDKVLKPANLDVETELAVKTEPPLAAEQAEGVLIKEEKQNEELEKAEGIYSGLKFVNVMIPRRYFVEVEEDVLVPDTKPDMREILSMDGRAVILNEEIGEIVLKTIYLSDKVVEDGVVYIDTKLQFKTKLGDVGKAQAVNAKVETAEYTIINERKFRVKCKVEVAVREYLDSDLKIFEGLKDDTLEVLKENIDFTQVALRKKDRLTLNEPLIIKENQPLPEKLIKSDIRVMAIPENIVDLKNVIYTSGNILTSKMAKEEEKWFFTGDLGVKVICQEDEGRLVTIHKKIPFKVMGDKNATNKEYLSDSSVIIKELWAEKINSKQMEINYTLVCYGQILENIELNLMKSPSYRGQRKDNKEVNFIVYVVKEDDDL